LSTETLDTLIRNLASSGSEVVIQRAEKPMTGEALPVTQPEEEAVRFKLDMARVAAISAETHEVIGLLAKAMAEDDEGNTGCQPFPRGDLPGGMSSAPVAQGPAPWSPNGTGASPPPYRFASAH